MNKMSVSRLACLPAARIRKYYRTPGLEKKFLGIQKSVIAAGKDTKQILSMTNMAIHAKREYFITFDEIIVEDDVTYCITRKATRKGTNPAHLERSKAQVALLGAMFGKSEQRLYTVRKLIDAGYPKKMVDLSAHSIVYVLDYDGVWYDIIPDEDSCLDWADAKMQAVDTDRTALAFDALPLPDFESWEM